MKVLFIARPDLPVPPTAYGGTERVLASLIMGMIDSGHDVTLFGHPDSTVPCRVVPAKEPVGQHLTTKRLKLRLIRRRIQALARKADLVHAVAPLHYLLPLLEIPKPLVLHFHSAVSDGQIELLHRHVRHPEAVRMVTCGRAMLPESATPGHRWLAIPNGIPVSRYDFVSQPVSPPYLAYLGRITEGKGVDIAVEVGAATGIEVRLAGPLTPLKTRGHHEDDRDFQSRIMQGAVRKGIATYVGELAHDAKVRHLGGATALLHPARVPEPFGLDVAESLACGTPVIALDRGEMPYLIRDGETGFLRHDLDGLVASVPRVPELSRAACRKYAEDHLDQRQMVQAFLETYQDLLSSTNRR